MLGNKGAKVSHKCFGAQGSQISYNDLHNQEERSSSHSHEQYETPFILKENGGSKKSGVSCDQQRNLAILFETKNYDY